MILDQLKIRASPFGHRIGSSLLAGQRLEPLALGSEPRPREGADDLSPPHPLDQSSLYFALDFGNFPTG